MDFYLLPVSSRTWLVKPLLVVNVKPCMDTNREYFMACTLYAIFLKYHTGEARKGNVYKQQHAI